MTDDVDLDDPEIKEFAEMEAKLPVKERMARESAVHFSGKDTTNIQHRLEHHRELTEKAKLARLAEPAKAEGPRPWENQGTEGQ